MPTATAPMPRQESSQVFETSGHQRIRSAAQLEPGKAEGCDEKATAGVGHGLKVIVRTGHRQDRSAIGPPSLVGVPVTGPEYPFWPRLSKGRLPMPGLSTVAQPEPLRVTHREPVWRRDRTLLT